MTRLTAQAIHLIREISAGRDRIFYTDMNPPGFRQLEHHGLAERAELPERAKLTKKGRDFARTSLKIQFSKWDRVKVKAQYNIAAYENAGTVHAVIDDWVLVCWDKRGPGTRSYDAIVLEIL